jgi:uncharacterized membrane protein YkoI
MKTKLILILFFCLGFANGNHAITLAKPTCLHDSDARIQGVAQKFISLDQAVNLARSKSKGDLVSAYLCQVPDGFMYKIAIIGNDGRVVKLLIDANTGNIVE